MVNLKMDDDERSGYSDAVMAPKPNYPYGLSLYLSDEILDKLGIEKPEVDGVYEFKVRAQVTNVSARKDADEEDGVCYDASLQITDMEVLGEKDSDLAKKLYGG